jgi:glycosyltransferase involved in cell wall biosynthesis
MKNQNLTSPKVSIIIPNYNYAKFLEQRLDSVFNQTFQDFEVILLDDCSTDHSVDILSEYKQHPKVSHFIINEINTGSPFKQWKKGIELAKGEFIWIAESDDWAELNFLEQMLPLMDNGNVGIAFCNSNWTNDKGEIKESLSIYRL